MTAPIHFALVLAIGAVGGWALGGDLLASVGLLIALVASFGLGWWVRGEEERHVTTSTRAR